jgi:hypothetical protein
MTRFIPGTDPLAPMQYTDAQRAELVARVRAATTPARLAAARATAARWDRYRATGAEPRRESHPDWTCPGRVAARYSALTGCTLTEAAEVMRAVCPAAERLSMVTVSRYWARLYPGVPARASRRGAA